MQQKESKTNWHFYISLVKSAIRMAAGATLYYGRLEIAGALFVLAEILGILEEL